MGVDQVRQADLFGERQDRHQPGRRHEIAFVEHCGPSRERVRWLYWKCLSVSEQS